jgi:hypothetical protein
MPFTHEQFLDVFARYNVALWPAAAALWLASAAAFIWLLRAGRSAARPIAALLAVHWAWAGIAYHAAFFTRINPSAWLFAALFLIEAVLLVSFGVVRARLRFSRGASLRHLLGFGFIGYGLLYPAIGLAAGQVFPRAATFGVPCPTTLLTAGFLLTLEPPLPRVVAIIPILWALVGGSAALLLRVPADWALFAAAVALGVNLARSAANTPEPARL